MRFLIILHEVRALAAAQRTPLGNHEVERVQRQPLRIAVVAVDIPCRLKALALHKGQLCGNIGEVIERGNGVPRECTRCRKLLNNGINVTHGNEEYDVLTVSLDQRRERSDGQPERLSSVAPQDIVAVCGDGNTRRCAALPDVFPDKARTEDHSSAAFLRQRIIY